MYTVPRVNVYKNVYTPSQGSQLGKRQFVYNPRVKRIRRFAAHTRATATACRSGPRNAESRGKVYTNPRARNLGLRRVVYSPPCECIQKCIHPIFNEFGYNPRSRQKTYTFARVNVYVFQACPTRFAFCVEPVQPRFRLAENRNIDRKCRTPLSCNAPRNRFESSVSGGEWRRWAMRGVSAEPPAQRAPEQRVGADARRGAREGGRDPRRGRLSRSKERNAK